MRHINLKLKKPFFYNRCYNSLNETVRDTSMGIEPWGRYLTGVIELIAGICILINPVSWFGSLLSLGTMAGAIIGHLTKLGIEVQGDGGLLFGLACIVFFASLINLFLERKNIRIFFNFPNIL